MKPCPKEAASRIIHKHFPNCQGGLLAGSTVRNEATETSDLDLVIFDDQFPQSYRESFYAEGWPVELFVHNLISYQAFFKKDAEAARPSMQRMVSEGMVIVDKGPIQSIKKEADEMLQNGPAPWTEETIQSKRYFITDALDDLIGSTSRAESIFIASKLAELLHEFVLRTNHCWIGSSKWIVRALKQYDEEFTKEFVEAFDVFYTSGDKEKVIQITELVLRPYGGKLFDGFSLGKQQQ